MLVVAAFVVDIVIEEVTKGFDFQLGQYCGKNPKLAIRGWG